MNIFNVMNFVRACDERDPNYRESLFNVTENELNLVNEFNIDNTFLLQYDALTDERYVKLFKDNASDKTEIGMWLEIVEPLTTACGLPYRSENGWKWDWHIIPGLPMGYTPEERKLLLREAMRKFKEVFGYYPKTVGGWLIDSYSVNYLSENYDIDAFCICRDQVNTDAYTLIGGYFNGGYYPSKSNMFTPAQTKENQGKTPVFRLLGPCPVNNYDSEKFLPESLKGNGNVYSLEPAWVMGKNEKCVDWFFKTYFENETLGFSAIQLGQENSFTATDLIPALRVQLEKAVQYVKDGKAEFKKYCDTGKLFKDLYNETPPTSVCAMDNWNEANTQSVYYNSKNYTINIFRDDKTIFVRAFYVFNEKIKDYYFDLPCTRFDAVYENLPIVDTVIWQKGNKENIGMVLDNEAEAFVTKRQGSDILILEWKDCSVELYPDKIKMKNIGKINFAPGEATADIAVFDKEIVYEYEKNIYKLQLDGGKVYKNNENIIIECENTAILTFICL